MEQPSQEEQDSFFGVGKEMWERASKVYELVDNFHDNRKEDEYGDDEGLIELRDLSKEIRQYKEESDKLIQKSIGYMYNGVLVSGDISCRKGKVYRFRCQYKLNNGTIKKAIMKNLQEVEKKLTSVNLGILETLLDFVDDNDNDGYSYRRNNNEEKAELELPHIRVAEFDRDNGVAFRKICKVTISENGELKFYNEEDRSISLDKYTMFMLKAKLKNELTELSSDFLEKQTAKRDNLLTQLTTIKSKALNLLMLAEIDKAEETQ